MPEVSRTRATLRSAELGFFGVWVNTRVHTPRRWGEPFSAGVFDFSGFVSRPLRTSCWIVGTRLLRAWIHGANCGAPGRHPGVEAAGREECMTSESSPLDNAVWHALTTHHRGFAEVAGSARRYHPEASVFAAPEKPERG